MKRKDYYPSYIPRKWIHFAEHGRKYRIRKKYRNRILQTVSSHPSDFETVLFNVMQHTSRSGMTTAELCRGLTAPPLPDYFRDCSPDDGIQIPDDIRQLSEKLEELRETIERAFTPVLDWLTELAGKIVKIVRDAVDRIWCNDRHWWYMAEHHKKRRIRKKYRTKIKRMARDRAASCSTLSGVIPQRSRTTPRPATTRSLNGKKELTSETSSLPDMRQGLADQRFGRYPSEWVRLPGVRNQAEEGATL